ncbi:hypothetical protein [Paraburkholderia oxyphila]|uniref:hypothetical protein n=1 Tax=Paraburkholderia oxyphila TaxID=614212 RepID=UPI0012EE2EAE|nr:hypothetical protein [Paraburkholderia oxyphila]
MSGTLMRFLMPQGKRSLQVVEYAARAGRERQELGEWVAEGKKRTIVRNFESW